MEECFIAIIPPEPILAKLNKIMKEMSSSLSSYKALTFPPHITLVHRFRTGNYKEFIKQLKLYCQEKEYVKVELLEFGYFDPPPIIFIHTKSSKNLHLELLELTKDFRTHWIRESFLKGKIKDTELPALILSDELLTGFRSIDELELKIKESFKLQETKVNKLI